MSKMLGKIVQVAVEPPWEEMPPGILALTSEGKLYYASDDVPPEEWVFTEVSLRVEV